MKKSRSKKRSVVPVATLSLCALLSVPALSSAATYTWDSNTGTTGAQDGAGTWSTSASGTNWWTGSNVAWSNLNTDTAVFGAGSAAGATVTVSSVTTNGITFNAPGSGNYTLSGGTITLDGVSPTITTNVDGTIGSVLAGTVGVVKSGTGTLTLTGLNTVSGALSLNQGTLTLSGAGKLSGITGVTVTGGTFNLGDATAANGLADRINTAATLTMGGANGGGIFSVVRGSTVANSQTLASLTVGAGGLGTINSGASAAVAPTLTFSPGANSYQRSSAGGIVNFDTTNVGVSFSGAPTAAGGSAVAGTAKPILIGALLKGNDLVSAASGAVAAPTYDTAWGSDATLNVTGGNITANTLSVNALRFSDATARTVTFQAGTTVIQSGMILFASTSANNSGIAQTSSVITSGNGKDLIIYDNRSIGVRDNNPVLVGAVIADNGATPIRLTIGGLDRSNSGNGGMVYLNPANTYSGGTVLDNGVVSIGADAAFGKLPGSAQANNITVYNSGYIRGYSAYALDAKRGITLVNNATLGLDGQNGNLTVNGAISGTGVLTGPLNRGGMVILNGANTFSGFQDINNGVLRANEGVGLSSNANLRFSQNGGSALNGIGGQLETSGTFTRSIGNGVGQVQWEGVLGAGNGYNSGGFTAYGAPLTVALGGTASPLTFKWGATVGGATVIDGYTVLSFQNSDANAALTWLNPLDLNGGSRYIGAGSATYGATLSGAISNSTGTAGVIMLYGGSLVFSGPNTYNGQTQIQNGTLSVASLNKVTGGTASSNLGAPSSAANGVIILSNANTTGTLLYTGAGETTDRQIQIGSGATTTANTASTIQNNGAGALVFSNSTFNAQDTTTASTTAARLLTLTGSNAGANTISGIIQDNAGAGTKTVALTKAGTGTWVLSGANTYSGMTIVSNGVLRFAKEASLYNNATGSWTAANINVKNGGTLAFNVGGGNGEFTTGDITTLLTNLGSSSGAANGMNLGSALGFDTTNASGGTFTIADNIADTTGGSGGARGLTKLGTNTLTLSGNNSYTGATNVNAGKLIVSGSLTGSTSVTDAVGATLQLNNGGYITTGGTVAVNGTLALSGSSKVGKINLNAGSTLSTIISGTAAGQYGQASSTGGITLASTGSGVTLSIATGYSRHYDIVAGLSASDKFVLALGNGTSVSGAFSNVASVFDANYNTTFNEYVDASGNAWAVFYNVNGISSISADSGSDIALYAIPEPTTWAMFVGGFGMLLSFQKMRRRSQQ